MALPDTSGPYVATDENELGIDFRGVKRVRQGSFATAFKWLVASVPSNTHLLRWYSNGGKG
ncbi:hypothetical protein HNQ71_004245 [Mesorhizobium sangaii]|uniref:Uncharacterized protein n=1 Tax=Mesorhizobium sangaii TaxID=505389 RepID=A0A841P8M3_9HYPH|nr:hypothetical protein [Mesorhizobium sangaii]